MPNFKMENVLGWSIFWVTSANEALEAHFDELVEWCMAVVFSVGSSGKLRIKTQPGEDAPDKWICREITGNSLYILRGSEHKHMSQVCDGEPGRRGVLVLFVKDEKTWPTTPANGCKQDYPGRASGLYGGYDGGGEDAVFGRIRGLEG